MSNYESRPERHRVGMRQGAAVVALGLASVLVLVAYSGVLAAQDATVTTWSVSATTISMDDSGNAWYSDGARTSIARLEPMATSTVTTWPIPVGGSTSDGTTVFSSSTQKVHFGEYISRPGLASYAIGRLDPATDTFTEWPFGGWDVISIAVDTSGDVWFGGSVCCYFPLISRLSTADNTVTTWQLPTAEGDWVRGIVPAPDGKVLFTIDLPGRVAELDPATGNVTLWPLDFNPIASSGSRAAYLHADDGLWFPGTDRIARFNRATNELKVWNLAGVATVGSIGVDTLGRPVIGGQVSSVAPLQGAARVDPATGVPTMWAHTSNAIRGTVVDANDAIWQNTSDLKIHRIEP